MRRLTRRTSLYIQTVSCHYGSFTVDRNVRLLIHWGRVIHICVGNLAIIGSDNSLSPGRHQAIIWTSDGILWIRPLGTNFSEILIEFLTFWFKKMRLNVSSAKWRPFCLGLNVLRCDWCTHYLKKPCFVSKFCWKWRCKYENGWRQLCFATPTEVTGTHKIQLNVR